MSPHKRLTHAKLLSHLFRLLVQPDTKVRLRKLKTCGQSAWHPDPPRDISIYLDPRRDGRVPLVLHELLHIYLRDQHDLHRRFAGRLEEEVVLGLEYALVRYVSKKDSGRLEKWDRAIKRKMEGARAAR